MSGFIFLCVFTITLIALNIYCFKSKKYLYLFVPCMLFLPNYYGIEISETAPIITVTRMMYVVFFIYAFINRKREFKLKHLDYRDIPKEYFLLAGYFIFRVVTNLYYVTTYTSAVKTIFAIVFEQLMLLFAFYLLNPSKKEIEQLLKIIIFSAAVLFVAGIFESIFDFKMFDFLYTVSRYMLNLSHKRLGLLRATTTMGMPGLYGNMCIFILPLIFYIYEKTGKFIYVWIALLDALAVIHSGARSVMLFYMIISFGYLVFVLTTRERRIRFCKNAFIVAAILFAYIGVTCAISERLNYYYIGNAKSLLNEFGFEFDLEAGAPAGSGGYGSNANGTVSRTRQFTGMYYVAKINPVFGLGAGAQNRGDVMYYWHHKNGHDKWSVVRSYDLGVVEVFCDEGAIGLAAFGMLFTFMLLKARRNRYSILLIFTYLLSTLNTVNIYTFLMLIVFLIATNGTEKEIVIK